MFSANVVLILAVARTISAEFLSENFSVKCWTWNNSITFHIAAKTHGWVSIGFNDQPRMKGADIVVAGLANNTRGYVYDMHDTKGHARPVVDDHQDYKLIWAQENDTHTFVSIRRPLKTNDAQDYAINEKPVNVLWAFSDKEFTSTKDFAYHGPENRGAKSIVLLKPDAEFKFPKPARNETKNAPKTQ